MEKQIIKLVLSYSEEFKIPAQNSLSLVEVETGGRGFDSATGKIIIQFEPSWFKKNAPYAPSGLWSLNGVERQGAEWKAFNDAFSKDKEAAMLSTSIGLGQIMGLHFKRLGYKSVGEMWDDAKKGINRQIYQLFKFVSTDKVLYSALKSSDWNMVAERYNGKFYMKLAQSIPREPYNISLQKSAVKFKILIENNKL